MFILKPSTTHGIGVFTLDPVREGERLDIWDEDDARELTDAEVAAQGVPEMMLVRFGIRLPGGYRLPLDFRRMSVGWYTNHSDTPNVVIRLDLNSHYFAIRDIAAGEEIFCDYRQLGEFETLDWTGSE